MLHPDFKRKIEDPGNTAMKTTKISEHSTPFDTKKEPSLAQLLSSSNIHHSNSLQNQFQVIQNNALLNNSYNTLFSNFDYPASNINPNPIINSEASTQTSDKQVMSDPPKKKRGRPRIHPLPDPKTILEKKAKQEKKKYMPLEKVISTILKQLVKLDVNAIFYNPVKDSIAPNYSKMIKYPMSFSKIKDKCSAKRYPTFAHAKRDFLLIFENCKQYNQDDTIYFQEAVRLEEEAKKLCDQFKDKLMDEDIGDLDNLPPPNEYGTPKQKSAKPSPSSPKKIKPDKVTSSVSSPVTPTNADVTTPTIPSKDVQKDEQYNNYQQRFMRNDQIVRNGNFGNDYMSKINYSGNLGGYSGTSRTVNPQSVNHLPATNKFNADELTKAESELLSRCENYFAELPGFTEPINQEDLEELKTLSSHGIDLGFLGIL